MAGNSNLTVTFRAVDQMSGPIRTIATNAKSASTAIQTAGKSMGTSFKGATSGIEQTASAMRDLGSAGSSMSGINSAVQSTTDSMRGLAESSEVTLRGLSNVGDEGTDAFSEIAEAAESASADLDDLSDAADNAGDEIAQTGDAFGKAEGQIDGIAEAASAASSGMEDVAEAAGDTNEELGKVGESFEETTEKTKQLGEEGSRSFADLASAIKGAAIVATMKEIADVVLEVVEAYAKFETATAKIATIADPTAMSIGDIRGQLMQLSRDTGDSATALAEANYQALSAGVKTADSVKFTAQAAKLATAGFTSQATAVDVLSTALNAYGMSATEVTQVSDYLVTTQNLGKTTVDELAATMGRVIPLASAYGVQMDNLAATYAQLTKQGINTAEATTGIKAALNELGDTGSGVSLILAEETGQSFTQLMESGMSLGDVMEILGNAAGGTADGFNALWSSQEAGIAGLAIYNAGAADFNNTLGQMQTSAGATAKAYATMSDTVGDTLNDLGNSFENIKIAAGDALAPTFTMLAEGLTSANNAVSEWISENQEFVSVAAAAGIAVTGFVGALTLIKTVGPLVATAVKGIGTAIQGAMGPIGWIGIAISAAAGAIVAFIGNLREQNKEFREAAPLTKDLYENVANLQAEYDAIAASAGEAAAAQSDVAVKLAAAQAEYSIMGETMEGFTDRIGNVIESSQSMRTEFQGSMRSMGQNEAVAKGYVTRLQELGEATNRSAGDMRLMQGLVSNLNDMYPGLNATVEDFTSGIDANVDAINAQIDAFGETSAFETYSDAIDQSRNKLQELGEAEVEVQAQLDAARERYENQNWLEQLLNWDDVGSSIDDLEEQLAAIAYETEYWTEAQSAAEEGLRNLGSTADEALSETEQGIQTANDLIMEHAGILEEPIIKWQHMGEIIGDSLQTAFGSMQDATEQTKELASASTESWETALESQVGYWEQFNSQIAALNSVTDEQLASIGMTRDEMQNLVASIDVTTDEGRSQIAALGNAVEEGNVEVIGKMAELQNAVAQGQSEAKSGLQELASGLDGAIQEMTQKVSAGIQEMTKPGEARNAANTTFAAFAEGIRGQISSAESAASAIGAAVQSAVASYSPQTIVVNVEQRGSVSNPVKGAARGTSFADNVMLVGEEGPEILYGIGGAKIIPAPATRRIMADLEEPETTTSARSLSADTRELLGHMEWPSPQAVGDIDSASRIFGGLELPHELTIAQDSARLLNDLENQRGHSSINIAPNEDLGQSAKETVRELARTLNINVNGKVAAANVDKSEIAAVMVEEMKDVFIGLLADEQYIEGAGAYVH